MSESKKEGEDKRANEMSCLNTLYVLFCSGIASESVCTDAMGCIRTCPLREL